MQENSTPFSNKNTCSICSDRYSNVPTILPRPPSTTAITNSASAASASGPKYIPLTQRKNTCPLCRMRFHQIRSNNRIYKVQVPTPPPPRSHPRPSVEPTRPPVPLLFFNNYPPTFNFFGPSMFINQNSPMNMPIPHFPGYVQSQTLIIAPQML